MSLTKNECQELLRMIEKLNMTLDGITDRTVMRASLTLINSDVFKKIQTKAEKRDREIDNRSREQKLQDPNFILCKRCDLVLAKKHIRRHERTPRCLETYKKKIATTKCKSTIVQQQELIILDKKDKSDILKIYEEEEELLKLIEEENRRIEEEEEE